MSGLTALGIPGGEARIRSDLDRIIRDVRDAAHGDTLAGVVLLGGYARGEGAVVEMDDGTWRGFNDYDLLLVFEGEPADRAMYAALSKSLAADLEIDFVDLGIALRDELVDPPATLFWFELGEIGKVLWQDAESADVVIPRIDPGTIPGAEEGAMLLLNRGMALLWAGARLWGDPPPALPDVAFSVIAAHKVVLAAGDAHLLAQGTYSVYQAERRARLESEPPSWAGDGFGAAYAAACEFRRSPAPTTVEACRELWVRSRDHHEAGFRHLENLRLRTTLARWEDHSRRSRDAAYRRRLGSPRGVASAIRRRLRGGAVIPPTDLFFGRLSGLLYGPSPADWSSSDLAAWKSRAMELVQQWHP